jgi:hypothetical protein
MVLSDPSPNGMIVRSHCLIRRPDPLFGLPDPRSHHLIERPACLIERPEFAKSVRNG